MIVFAMMISSQKNTIYNQELFSFLRNKSGYEITFTGTAKSCCVGIVDIVNSTAITTRLTNEKMCEYYSVFLNAMARILRRYNVTVVKNMGDSLLYYFPRTEDGIDKMALADVIECGLQMIDSHEVINMVLGEFNLPRLDYRISADYGMISIATCPRTDDQDVFGPTVNLCSKINGAAKPNSLVIGGDLHQIIKSLRDYEFDVIGEYMLGLKLNYPVYSVCHRIEKSGFRKTMFF